MTDASRGRVCRSSRISDETTELAHRYAEALIGAAEKEGGVDPVLEELGEIETRRPESVSAVRGIAGFASGFDRSERPHPDRGLRQRRLEPGFAVPAGPEPS